MPTHMRNPFTVEELRDIELAAPFSFTKGCQTVRVPAQAWRNPYPFGTMLFNLRDDPRQEHPIKDQAVEDMMVRHMVRPSR